MGKLCTTHCTEKAKRENRVCMKGATGHDDRMGGSCFECLKVRPKPYCRQCDEPHEACRTWGN